MRKLLIFMLCFILVGCSSKTEESTKEKIKIGVVTHADYQEYDKALINGINSAIVESFSDKYEYEAVYVQSYDIQGTYKQMADDGIKYVIGDLSCQEDESRRLEVVSPVKYTEGAKNIYVTFEEQGKFIADFANKENMLTAAILYNSDIDYSRGLAKAFEQNYEGQIKIVKTFTNKTSDFTDILSQIKEFNPQIVFIPEYYPNVNKIYEQCQKMRITSTFLGGDGWQSAKNQEGVNIKEGYFFTQYSMSLSTPLSYAFVKQYNKIYGENPNTYAALGYDAVKYIINEIEAPDTEYDGLTIKGGTKKGVMNYIDYDGYVMYEEMGK